MGLLTDPNSGGGNASRLVSLIVSHHKKLSWLLYLAGLVFLLVLAHPLYNEKTYFSENALLPGLVTGSFSEERAAVEFMSQLGEENRKYPGHAPFPWLEAQFKQMGLEVILITVTIIICCHYHHNFITNTILIIRSTSSSLV